jgi:hypothetical protein
MDLAGSATPQVVRMDLAAGSATPQVVRMDLAGSATPQVEVPL